MQSAAPRGAAKCNGIPNLCPTNGARVESERLVCAGNTKQTQSGSVEQQYRTAESIDEWVAKEHNQSGQNGDSDITPFVDRCGWKSSNHNVAGNPTRVARNEAENQNSKGIESVLDCGYCTAQGEDERPGKIKDDQKRSHYVMTVNSDLVHAVSQA